MIAVSTKNLSKSFGTTKILEDITFNINAGDCVGIIGENGAGKSTLLNILTSQTEASEGTFFVNSSLSLGYLRQSDTFNDNDTIIDACNATFKEVIKIEEDLVSLQSKIEAFSKSSDAVNSTHTLQELSDKQDMLLQKFEALRGYTYKSEIRSVLKNLGFDSERYNDKISSLSGGQKTRLAIGCLLLKAPNILLLDEPTNHLDIDTLAWFEKFIRDYSGTVIIISHDRYFLDKTVSRVFEIKDSRLEVYEGNYSFYANEKIVRQTTRAKEYESWQKEVKRQEEMIRRFKQHGTEKLAKRAASREKRLASIMEEGKQPVLTNAKHISIKFTQTFKSGTDVLFAENLGKSFGYGSNINTVFENINLDIKRGEKICIIGQNGAGKSTLLRVLVGDLSPTSGYMKFGHNVKLGYYDQAQQNLNEAITPFEELHNAYPMLTHGEVRAYLSKFLFGKTLAFTPIRAISGGQKARLSLLKLMLSGANLLILDEPTNHLDIESKEVIEKALNEFEGTCIIVSHDRYLLSKLPNRILELTQNKITNYLGKYDYYLEKRKTIEDNYIKASNMINSSSLSSNLDSSEDNSSPLLKQTSKDFDISSSESTLSSNELRLLQKEAQREKRRLEREKTKLENEIQALENEIEEIETLMCSSEMLSNPMELNKLNDKLLSLKNTLDVHLEKWLQYE